MKNSIHNYKISIPKHSITTLLTMLKNASKLLKENIQKSTIALVINLKVIAFDQIYSHFTNINIYYYLKLQIPIMHRHFFTKLSQNPEYIETHCNDRRKPFRFACRKWYIYILIHIKVWYNYTTSNTNNRYNNLFTCTNKHLFRYE